MPHTAKSFGVIVSLSCSGIVLALLACSSSSDNGGESPSPEAGVAEAGPSVDASIEASVEAAAKTVAITVTTTSTGQDLVPSVKTSATWAAVRDGTGAWRAVNATTVGVYSFAVARAVADWSLALVCASPGGGSSSVAIFNHPIATTTLDVELDAECTPTPLAAFALSGSLSNVPTTTTWLNFGYPLSSRGAVQPVTLTTASYEIINVGSGTWDFAFGLRDDPALPLTRVALRRAQPISADKTLDVDFGAVGIATVPKAFVLHGVTAAEDLAPLLRFVTSGFSGLDVGPQNVPNTTPDLDMTYDSLPATSLVATDRYRVDITAADDATKSSRLVTGSFHAAADIDVTLPDVFPLPVASVQSTQPYPRVGVQVVAHANASTYELAVEAALSRTTRRRWSASIAALLGSQSLSFVVPDLSTVAGFKAEWALPSAGDLTVTGGAIEKSSALSDGTIARIALRSITFTR